MTDVGTIKMKTPRGRDSSISVTVDGDDVDIHFVRSSQGELPVHLTRSQSSQLAALLVAAKESP